MCEVERAWPGVARHLCGSGAGITGGELVQQRCNVYGGNEIRKVQTKLSENKAKGDRATREVREKYSTWYSKFVPSRPRGAQYVPKWVLYLEWAPSTPHPPPPAYAPPPSPSHNPSHNPSQNPSPNPSTPMEGSKKSREITF